jgi:ribosomal protein S6
MTAARKRRLYDPAVCPLTHPFHSTVFVATTVRLLIDNADEKNIDFYNMSKTMKKVAVEVVTGGGIVRGIHNHGFRDLAHRFKAKFADKEGKRYYEIGRFISIYYDANPATMRGVEQILKLDEEILRNTHLRARSVLDICNTAREHKNPFIQRAHELGLFEQPASSSSSMPPPPSAAQPDGK